MGKKTGTVGGWFDRQLNKMGLSLRARLITIFIVVKVIPLMALTLLAWWQISDLGDILRQIAVEDASTALDDSAIENIERITTDTAAQVADFLYGRDDDLLYLADIAPDEEAYRLFLESKVKKMVSPGEWVLAENGRSWVPAETKVYAGETDVSTNQENDDEGRFHYRPPDEIDYIVMPLYEEITFVGLDGVEQIKVTAPRSTKVNYPLSAEKRDVSRRENTYVKAETYFEKLQGLKPGEIYVSDVIGAYVGSNYIGMYTPAIVGEAAAAQEREIPYDPEGQAYAGMENPYGQRFEGIVRWATPVTGDSGQVIGYLTMALNHDHIMEFVDHITPMLERYTELPNAFDGNYAFIWDYNCRSICHPRHHSITGYDPETGEPQIPWLETSIYEGWQESGLEKWTDYVADIPSFDNQSRSKAPALSLTRRGLVGLDGRYLNNAPQCTGWMDLTRDGGSGSFYILWSGLYKLTTAGAIPYYTGQYAPSQDNGFSRRGFGFVAVGAGLEDFVRPATEMELKLGDAITESQQTTTLRLVSATGCIILLVVIIAVWLASSVTGNITQLIDGISHYRRGERQFRFNTTTTDEFGTLADAFDDMADSIEDSVKNPLTIIDTGRRIIYMNEPGLAFCRLTLEDAVGTLYADSSIYPSGTRYDPITALEEGRESEIYFEPASRRYLKGSASYFVSKTGQRLGYMVETADVTDMALIQIKTEEQRTLLDRIFSASPDLIWYKNTAGTYLAVNPRFASVAGISADEMVGRTGREVLPPAVGEGILANDDAVLSSPVPLHAEEEITFADGHQETLDSVRTPIFDQNGLLVGLLGYARNVSARVAIEARLRHTQLELEQAVSDANRANEHKGEFLARMSHEIRTPMNAIIGVTNIVLKKLGEMDPACDPNGEIKGHVGQIEASSQHLLGLLNDILDISKIEAGKIELTRETVELSKLAATVAGIIRPRCEEKSLTFVTDFDEFIPGVYICDSLRLRQVLINLLGNAVKFTPDLGTVEYRIRVLKREGGKSLLEFTVADNGIGIAPEAMEAIFQPFEQGDGSISRQYGGTGLGLSISQRIVELFGGRLEVESQPGAGSAFRFAIWLEEAEDHEAAPSQLRDATGRFRGRRVLLVDDVEINRIIVASMLESTGVEIEEAADGLAALEAFKASGPGDYDLILMDVKMPILDGYEASAAIRALDRADAQAVPIVALTANAFQDDINRAISNGMNAHIAKPVEEEVLLETMFRFLPPRD